MGCGNQFIFATYAPEPYDAGDADHPLSSETDSPGKIESYRIEFGAAFGAHFSESPACTGTMWHRRGGDRSPLAIPDLYGDPVGVTDPDQTVSHDVNQITDFEFDDYTEGTFPLEWMLCYHG